MILPFQHRPRVPRKAPEPPKEKPKPDFFGPKGSISRSEFREKLRKAAPEIPLSSRWMTRERREALEKKFSYGKYGPDISRDDIKGLIKELQQAKTEAKTYNEREEIDRTIRWLKKTTGIL